MTKTGWILFAALILLWLLTWAWMPCDNVVWNLIPESIEPQRCI